MEKVDFELKITVVFYSVICSLDDFLYEDHHD